MNTNTYYEVTYFSPGSFLSEQDTYEFKELDFKKICDKAKKINQRYNAKPYGFSYKKIETLKSIPKIDGFEIKCKPKILKSSGMYYITGELVFSENIKDETLYILKRNLEYNSDGIGVENNNSYRYNGFFHKEDFIIGWDGEILRTGKDKDLMDIRKANKIKMDKIYG